jgi:hypothetical protein
LLFFFLVLLLLKSYTYILQSLRRQVQKEEAFFRVGRNNSP